jgi:hypothetical protein
MVAQREKTSASTSTNQVSSILAADFGSVHTRIVLVDVVDGEYRLVARESGLTTLGYPVDDLSIGLHQLLDHIEKQTGRRFYNQSNQIVTPEGSDRTGVDLFITTASAGRPLRAVLVGLMPDISIISALRAISGAYTESVAEIHLHDGKSEEERLNAIILSRPDLIFVAGGTDGGATTAMQNLLQLIQLALNLTDRELRPLLLYAGNRKLQNTVRDIFGELTHVLIADNIRPNIEKESFESVLLNIDRAYDGYRETHGEAFLTVGQMSNTGLLPTAQSYALLAEYLAKVQKGNVIAVDMGSSSTVLVGVFKGQSSIQISTTRGLGHSADLLQRELGTKAIANWLPFYPESGEIRNYALNKSVRPSTIPMTLRDLYKEHAFLRAGLRDMLAGSRQSWKGVEERGALPPVKTILLGGAALTETGNAAYSMMLAADSIQPTGLTQVFADTHGLIPALGALARIQPAATVQLIEGGDLELLGTLLSFEGQAAEDKIIAKLRIKDQSGQTLTDENEQAIEPELKGGHLLLLPLPEGYEVQVRCMRGHSVGGQSKFKLKISGEIGMLLLDARGRPFSVANDVEKRAIWMPQWIHEATDNPLLDIPAEWLIKPATPVQEKVSAVKKSRKGDFLDIAELAGVDVDDDAKEFLDTLETEAITDAMLEDENDEDDEFGSLRDLLG